MAQYFLEFCLYVYAGFYVFFNVFDHSKDSVYFNV